MGADLLVWVRPRFLDFQLDTSDSKSIAARQLRPRDSLVIDERAVGALEVDDFQVIVARFQPAVKS